MFWSLFEDHIYAHKADLYRLLFRALMFHFIEWKLFAIYISTFCDSYCVEILQNLTNVLLTVRLTLDLFTLNDGHT